MKPQQLVIIALTAALCAAPASAEERTLTEEQKQALETTGDLVEEAPERPAKLPDFTTGAQLAPMKFKPQVWTLGPTGIMAIMNGREQGDQLLVQGTLADSPSDGKFVKGDVITGLNGTKFVAGGHLGILIGNAIVEAEREANGGRIVFQVWRDKNHPARTGKQDVTTVDIDKLFQEAHDDDSLYDWKPEEERTEEVTKMGFDKYPLDPVTLDIELKLRVFPDYADTAPYDCPKTARILEDAWKVLEKKFVADPGNPRSGRGGILEAIALVASGKPEHRALVHEWVRGRNSPWNPPKDPPGTMFKPDFKGHKGYQSWHHGFNGLNCALYYEATGDDYVLPALRKFAIDTAMGQSALGSWGHTFAYPSFNGGELHQMNPGYGALNAAGNRCFFLVTLAQKLGIEHPEIDLAVKRGRRFFSSYIDQGCIPYGDHPAYASDDSNGKNTGVAFSLNLLGDKYGAKYFAMMSSHCAFTRRGGHGHDYHGEWSSWAAGLCGPEVRAYNERNLRWRRTLCRMHDGSFIYQSPTGGRYGTLRDPTATEVLHQAVIFKQTLITGKNPDETLYPTEREMKQLLTSATGQFNDPWLEEKAGTRWKERTSEELIDLLDIFYPKARANFAKELGERFARGEREIPERLLFLLESEMPRFRDGALRGLAACGGDVVLSNLSKITKLLEDPNDFVRITAVNVISRTTADENAQLALLKATVAEPGSIAPNAVRNVTQSALFGRDTPLANDPFGAGFDQQLVEEALEKLILLDPVGGRGFLSSRNGKWDRNTVVRLAGPLTYIAEEEQVGDQMFANRAAPAQAMLSKFGYAEGIQATAHRLRKQAAIARDIRPLVGFKGSLMDAGVVEKQPAAFTGFIAEMETILTDNPLARIEKRVDGRPVGVPLESSYKLVKAQSKAAALPSIAVDSRKAFEEEIDAAVGSGAKIKLCRDTLAETGRMDDFRKIAAMDFLAEMLGPDALEDLLPYLGEQAGRLRNHARQVAAKLTASGGAEILWDLHKADDQRIGVLAVYAISGAEEGRGHVRAMLKHESAPIRAAAIRALAAIDGSNAIEALVEQLASSVEREPLLACEDALLSLSGDPDAASQIRERIVALLGDANPAARRTSYYILSRIGDPESIAALRKAGDTDSTSEFAEIVFALSYSPSREADAVLLDFAAKDSRAAKVVGEQSVRRMVLGPAGFGDISADEKLDFAEAMLRFALDERLIGYLGRIHEARSLRALMYCLKKGVENAAGTLVSCAEGMGKLSSSDAKIAAGALQDVIEYIEVTKLRGGVERHMEKDDKYAYWKALQARAGKLLLELHKPEEAPIPEFDPLDFDE